MLVIFVGFLLVLSFEIVLVENGVNINFLKGDNLAREFLLSLLLNSRLLKGLRLKGLCFDLGFLLDCFNLKLLELS